MDSLYRQTISSVVGNFKTLNGDWKCCPDKIVFDVVIELYRKELFDLLTPILKDSQIFCRLLKARTNFHFYRSRFDHCLYLPSSAINSRSSALLSYSYWTLLDEIHILCTFCICWCSYRPCSRWLHWCWYCCFNNFYPATAWAWKNWFHFTFTIIL